MSLQKIQVIGNLTRDCQINNVQGKQVINISVACNEKYKNNEGTVVNKVSYYDAAYWTDKTAIATYLKKGTQVFIEGTPSVKIFTTQDGKQGANISIRVNSIQLLGSSNQNTPAPNTQSTNSSEQSFNTHLGSHSTELDNDAASDLPF